MEAEEQVLATAMCTLIRDEAYIVPEAESEALAMAFASKRDMELEKFPMHPELLEKEQLADKELQESLRKSQDKYSKKTLENATLIMYQDKIVVPKKFKKQNSGMVP